MELEKLNECILEMDTLSSLTFDYKNISVEIRFNCLGGGCYEDVDLLLILEDPSFYQLPFVITEEEFQVFEYSVAGAKEIIPEGYYESGTKVLGFKIRGKVSKFYCCFSSITWSVSGGGFVKNQHELAEPPFS